MNHLSITEVALISPPCQILTVLPEKARKGDRKRKWKNITNLDSKTSKACSPVFKRPYSKKQPLSDEDKKENSEVELIQGSVEVLEEEVFNKSCKQRVLSHFMGVNGAFASLVEEPELWEVEKKRGGSLTKVTHPPPFALLPLPLTMAQRSVIKEAPVVCSGVQPKKDSVGSLLAKQMKVQKQFEKLSQELTHFRCYVHEIRQGIATLSAEEVESAEFQLNHMETSLKNKTVTHHDLKKKFENVSKKIQTVRDEMHTAFMYFTHIRF